MTTQIISQPAETNLLRFSLRLDCVIVAISGALLIAAAQPVVEFLGVGAPWMMVAGGIVFLIYAFDLWWVSSREPINRTLGWSF